MPPSRTQPPATRRRRGSATIRLRLGFIVIAMVLSLFGARLVQLQGIDPKSYAAMAAAEGLVRVTLPAERGDILDRNGEPLADSVAGLMVVADPAQQRHRRVPVSVHERRRQQQLAPVDHLVAVGRRHIRPQGRDHAALAAQADDVAVELRPGHGQSAHGRDSKPAQTLMVRTSPSWTT